MEYIIYVNIESFIKKVDNCKYNPERSSTRKVGKHIPLRIFNVNKLGITLPMTV